MPLTGPQIEKLRNAILSAYDSASLEQTLLYRLNIKLFDVVAEGPFQEVVFHFIRFIENQGNTAGVLQSLKDDRSENHDLVAVCDELLQALNPLPLPQTPAAAPAEAANAPAPFQTTFESVSAAKQKLAEIEAYLKQITGRFPAPDAVTGPRSILQPILDVDDDKARGLRQAFGFPLDYGRSAQLFKLVDLEESSMRPILGIFSQRVYMLMWRLRYTLMEIQAPWATQAREAADGIAEVCDLDLLARQPTLRIFDDPKEVDPKEVELRLKAVGEPAPDVALYAALRAIDHAQHSNLPVAPATLKRLHRNALDFVLAYLNDLLADRRQVEDSSNAWWSLRVGLCTRDDRFLALLPRVAEKFSDVRISSEKLSILVAVPEIYRPIRTACYTLSNIQAILELHDYIPADQKPVLHQIILALLDRLLASPRFHHLYLASVHHEGLRNFLDYVRDQKVSVVTP